MACSLPRFSSQAPSWAPPFASQAGNSVPPALPPGTQAARVGRQWLVPPAAPRRPAGSGRPRTDNENQVNNKQISDKNYMATGKPLTSADSADEHAVARSSSTILAASSCPASCYSAGWASGSSWSRLAGNSSLLGLSDGGLGGDAGGARTTLTDVAFSASSAAVLSASVAAFPSSRAASRWERVLGGHSIDAGGIAASTLGVSSADSPAFLFAPLIGAFLENSEIGSLRMQFKTEHTVDGSKSTYPPLRRTLDVSFNSAAGGGDRLRAGEIRCSPCASAPGLLCPPPRGWHPLPPPLHFPTSRLLRGCPSGGLPSCRSLRPRSSSHPTSSCAAPTLAGEEEQWPLSLQHLTRP